MDRHIVWFANSKHGATTSQLISSAHPVVLYRAWPVCSLGPRIYVICGQPLSKVDRLRGVLGRSASSFVAMLGAQEFATVVLYGFVLCWKQSDTSHCCLPKRVVLSTCRRVISPGRFQTCLSLESEGSCSTRQCVG